MRRVQINGYEVTMTGRAHLKQCIEALDTRPELFSQRAARHLVNEGGRVLDCTTQRLCADDGREMPRFRQHALHLCNMQKQQES